jgi:hypothetical protein
MISRTAHPAHCIHLVGASKRSCECRMQAGVSKPRFDMTGIVMREFLKELSPDPERGAS